MLNSETTANQLCPLPLKEDAHTLHVRTCVFVVGKTFRRKILEEPSAGSHQQSELATKHVKKHEIINLIARHDLKNMQARFNGQGA